MAQEAKGKQPAKKQEEEPQILTPGKERIMQRRRFMESQTSFRSQTSDHLNSLRNALKKNDSRVLKPQDSSPRTKVKAVNLFEDPSKKNPRSLFKAYLGKTQEKSLKKFKTTRPQRSPTP